jgi:hypothetical protein
MVVVGKFIREVNHGNPDCDGPYTVMNHEKCPECFCEFAVTVRNNKQNIVWLSCNLCGTEFNLEGAIRA